MPRLILHPDVQFDGPADLEAAVYGNRFAIHASRSADLNAIPAEVWRAAEGLVCYHEITVDETVLDRMPACRVVVRAGVGFDNIDLDAAGRRGIAVCNTPDYGTTDVADHAIALTLAVLRGVVAYNDLLQADPVAGWDFSKVPTVRRLSTQTFGVVGLGRIGTATALRAKALGMRVRFFDPYRPTGSELALGIERAGSLEDLLGSANVVSLHTPLTTETRHLISTAALAAMKPDAVLVNTARGGVVDLLALYAALAEGRLGAAALDVLETEPLPADHPLLQAWRAPGSPLRHRLIVTPHAAFYSPSSLIDLRQKSAATAAGYLQDGHSRDCVNADRLDLARAAARRPAL
ncbi:C-terminal binding protein [Geminicoccus harenae]|uniref:C-terminal binding protein n=1 Tax=Geminicoccus harenae TaxID=2498453 RepID=UPI00168B843F|nr:C-terminal binding protein [Geminicoccus harenae]